MASLTHTYTITQVVWVADPDDAVKLVTGPVTVEWLRYDGTDVSYFFVELTKWFDESDVYATSAAAEAAVWP